MDHIHAIDSGAVERYLLSEMSADERDAFEDHYFSCSECAENVRTAVQFRDAARLHLQSEPAPAAIVAEVKPRRKWWSLPQVIPSGFAAAMAGVVLYLVGVEIPDLKSRTGTPEVAVRNLVTMPLHGATRGELDRVPRGGESFTLYFDAPAENAAGALECEFATSKGKAIDAIPCTATKTGVISLLLSRAAFPSGDYAITVRQNKTVVSQQNFIVE